MAKATTKKGNTPAKKELINATSYAFLKTYINNASPVGFETSGQKLWLDYIKQYVDTTFTDAYGTALLGAVVRAESHR